MTICDFDDFVLQIFLWSFNIPCRFEGEVFFFGWSWIVFDLGRLNDYPWLKYVLIGSMGFFDSCAALVS